MKKYVLLASLLFFLTQKNAMSEQCSFNYQCASISETKNTIGTIVSQFTGIDFLQIRATEFAIEQYIKNKLNTDIHIEIQAKSAKALRNGEFQAIYATADKLKIQNFQLSDFKAKTLCPINKFIYQNNEYKFPYDIPAEYSATITNEDLNLLIANYLNNINFNGIGKISVETILVNSKLYIIITLSTAMIKKTYKISSGLTVENNRLKLSDYNISNNSIILKQILMVIDKINPMLYSFKIGPNAYCYINVEDLHIIDNKIYIKGMFIIPKNYDIT